MDKTTIQKALIKLASKVNPIIKTSYDALFNEAEKRTIGRPIPFKMSYMSMNLLNSLDYQNSDLFEDYYIKYSSYLSKKAKRYFYKSFRTRFFKDGTQKQFDILISYYQDLEPSQYASNELFHFITSCEYKIDDKPKYKEYLIIFFERLTPLMEKSFILTNYSSGLIERKKIFLKYKIKSSFTPTAKECGRKMNSEKSDGLAFTYVEFLTMMGKNAKPAEQMVIQRLKEVKNENSSYASSTEKELITVLKNIDTDDKIALKLIIQALSSKKYMVSKHAKNALIKLGSKSLYIIMNEYTGKEDYVKIRMIEIVGTYKSKKVDSIKFLQQIQSNNSLVKRAKEDALDKLKS